MLIWARGYKTFFMLNSCPFTLGLVFLFTSFPALSVNPRFGISRSASWTIEFLALSVDLRVGISRSASETGDFSGIRLPSGWDFSVSDRFYFTASRLGFPISSI